MKPSKVFTKWTDLEIKKTKLKKKKNNIMALQCHFYMNEFR